VDLFSIIVLVLVQGITEWIPISSKTQVTLVYLQFLGGNPSLVIPILLYSHLGTLFAASIYFRKEIIAIFDAILSNPFNYRTYATGKTGFLITALLFTGLAGIPILYIEKTTLPCLNGSFIFVLMGIGLILTGFLLFSPQTGNLPVMDGISLTISSFIFGYLSLDIILSFVKRINIVYLATLLGALIIIVAYFQYG
jgi:undecaprenyl-diphosphatase